MRRAGQPLFIVMVAHQQLLSWCFRRAAVLTDPRARKGCRHTRLMYSAACSRGHVAGEGLSAERLDARGCHPCMHAL